MQETDVEQLLTDLKSDDFRIVANADWKFKNLATDSYTPELIEKLLDLADGLSPYGKIVVRQIVTHIKTIALPVLLQKLATASKTKLEIIVEVLLTFDNLEESFIAELIWKVLQNVDSAGAAQLSFKFAASKYKQVANKYLLSLLAHPDLKIAKKANEFLTTGLNPIEQEELLAPLLQDPNVQVRQLVISNFINYNGHSEQSFVKEALLRALDDSDPEVYGQAIVANANHKLLTQPVFEQLVQLLQEPTTPADLVGCVVFAVWLLPEFATPATANTLIELFARTASFEGSREQIALTLAKIKSIAALPMLKEAFPDAEDSFKIALAGAILSLEPDSKAAQDFLLENVQNSDMQKQIHTTIVIEQIGLAAKPLAKQLANLVFQNQESRTGNNENTLYPYSWVIQILGRIEPELLIDAVCDVSNKNLSMSIVQDLSDDSLERLLNLLEPRAAGGDTAVQAGIELIKKNQLLRKEQNFIRKDPKF